MVKFCNTWMNALPDMYVRYLRSRADISDTISLAYIANVNSVQADLLYCVIH